MQHLDNSFLPGKKPYFDSNGGGEGESDILNKTILEDSPESSITLGFGTCRSKTCSINLEKHVGNPSCQNIFTDIEKENVTFENPFLINRRKNYSGKKLPFDRNPLGGTSISITHTPNYKLLKQDDNKHVLLEQNINVNKKASVNKKPATCLFNQNTNFSLSRDQNSTLTTRPVERKATPYKNRFTELYTCSPKQRQDEFGQSVSFPENLNKQNVFNTQCPTNNVTSEHTNLSYATPSLHYPRTLESIHESKLLEVNSSAHTLHKNSAVETIAEKTETEELDVSNDQEKLPAGPISEERLKFVESSNSLPEITVSGFDSNNELHLTKPVENFSTKKEIQNVEISQQNFMEVNSRSVERNLQVTDENQAKSTSKKLIIRGKEYIVVCKLGEGGSCQVFDCLTSQTLEQRAIKVVSLAVDNVTARGYINEVKMLKSLQRSEYVIKMYD